MTATGMNPFINAQGFPLVGMTTVTLGAAANIALDPLFIFTFGLGIQGAAIATVLSQAVSALFVIRFLTGKQAVYRLVRYPFREFLHEKKMILDIVGLGISSFVMQFTNSLVSIACNGVLSDLGGDTYISVMTIISSVRQIMDTPVMSLTEGASPFLSYNYGARRPRRVRNAIAIMTAMALSYTLLAWIFIVCRPEMVISIFTSDPTLIRDAVPALHLYFFAFVFQSFQYAGQTAFKALNKKKHNVFFSLLRKVVIVIPLTYILPYVFHLGTDGVFMAEPVSNVIGGLACFITMLLTILPELKRMEEQ
jgi:Na+-driven multidrug efflux pump